ncbi:hypothetical protein ACS0TY_024165 [Phlomoides rotata]
MALSLFMITSLVLFFLPNQLHSQSSSDTTYFDFTIFDGKEADLIYQGDAHIATRPPAGSVVPPGQTFIRLTRAGQHRPFPDSAGRVLYSPPIRLWDAAGRRQANFQTVIRGYIGDPSDGRESDGFAFFIAAAANTSIPPGSTGGHMGLYDATGVSPVPLVAVELDVFPNTWDPSYRHLGINVNSRRSFVEAFWRIGGLRREVEAIITYDARHRLLSALANATNSQYEWAGSDSARVEANFELKSILPEWVQIGISASTGPGAVAFHDIRRWFFISFMESDAVTHADH